MSLSETAALYAATTMIRRMRTHGEPWDEDDVREDWTRHEPDAAQSGRAILFDHFGADDVRRHNENAKPVGQ